MNTNLTSLSWQPHRPMMLIRWQNATVLIDCALDMSSLNHYIPFSYTPNTRFKNLPEFNPSVNMPFLKYRETNDSDMVLIDGVPEVHPTPLNAISMDTVDVILISNWNSLLALPFYTEETGFKGTVYATDPTVQFGRLMMEEIIEYFARFVTDPVNKEWKNAKICNTFPNLPIRSPLEWREFYSTSQMENALKRITTVAFRETVSVLGCLSISAYGSGHSMGSCNWTIHSEQEKIGYLAASSTRKLHSRLIDLEKFRKSDRLIATSLMRGLDPEIAVSQMLSHTIETLKSGGNVLLPIAPTGVIFDLIELIANNMQQTGVSLDVPIYFISPVAKKALAFANVNAEWLSELKQNNVYKPEEPFGHAALLESNRLRVYDSLYGAFSQEFRSPCVMLAGHPSLRIGDAAHLLELWGNDPKNCVILTDPDYPIYEVYGPFKDLKIRAFYSPIDTRIDFPQLNATLHDLKPNILYVPDAYVRKEGLTLQLQYNPFTAIRYEDSTNISSRNKKKRMRIHPDLIRSLNVSGNVLNLDSGMCSINGNLCAFDNAFELVPAKRSMPVRPKFAGKLTSASLIEAFEKRKIGITPNKPDEINGIQSFVIERPPAIITIMEDGMKTNVDCQKREDRTDILEIIGSCLVSV